MEQIRKKVQQWKTVFAKDYRAVSADCSWIEILSAIKPSNAMFLCLFNKAMTLVGEMSPEQQAILATLSGYSEVISILSSLTNKQCTKTKSILIQDVAMVYLFRHKELEDKNCETIFIEVTIVPNNPSEAVDIDMLVLLSGINGKILNIHYGKKASKFNSRLCIAQPYSASKNH